MPGSAPPCPVLKGAIYWEQGQLPMPSLFPGGRASADARTKGERREEWPEKNASVSMTLGPSPEDAGRLGSLHLYPLEGELGPYWGERPSESWPCSEGCLGRWKEPGLRSCRLT